MMCRVYVTVCLFVAVADSGELLSATPSGKIQHIVGAEQKRFLYTKERTEPEAFNYSYRRSPEVPCQTCIGYNCLQLGDSRCEYFTETARVFADDEENRVMEADPEIKREVDLLMYIMMEKANADPEFKQCIPLISSYSNCNKENTCTGCQVCACGNLGTWTCGFVQKCRSEPLHVDHAVLQVVLESLAGLGEEERETTKMDRIKRNAFRIQAPTVSEWLSSAGDQTRDLTINEITPTDAPSSSSATPQQKKSIDNETDTEFSFDDILTLDENKNQFKPTIQETPKYTPNGNDYNIDKIFEMLHLIDDIDRVSSKSDLKFKGGVDTVTREMFSTSTALPKSIVGNELQWTFPIKDYVDIDNTKVSEEANGIYAGNAVTVMKRDVSSVNQQKYESNDTRSLQDLNDNVLIPLTNIIQEKQSEIDELRDIKVKIIEFLSTFTNGTVFESNKTNVEKNNTHFSIYKLEIRPQSTESNLIQNNYTQYERRRTNGINITTTFRKLKRDMFEVMKDIIHIKKLSKSKELPRELKFVIASMRHYIHKQMGKDTRMNETLNAKSMKDFFRQTRRSLSQNKNFYILKSLLNIFQVIDKGMPQSNALDPLSHNTREISKRVIRQVYEITGDYKIRDLDVKNPHFNLTNDLNDIGSTWHQLANDIAGCSLSDRLYKIKLLHLALSNDIQKMVEAKALLSFAHTRRMVPVEDDQGEEILMRIDHDLQSVSHKIRKIFEYFNNTHKKTSFLTKTPNTRRKSPKKESFLEYVRHLLKNSKTGFLKLMHKNVPKANKTKEELSLRELEDEETRMTEYENINKWETDLQVVPLRRKRHVSLAARVQVMKSRLRHILPKYLRGKVTPEFVHGTKKTNRKKQRQRKMELNKPVAAINNNHIHEHITGKKI